MTSRYLVVITCKNRANFCCCTQLLTYISSFMRSKCYVGIFCYTHMLANIYTKTATMYYQHSGLKSEKKCNNQGNCIMISLDNRQILCNFRVYLLHCFSFLPHCVQKQLLCTNTFAWQGSTFQGNAVVTPWGGPLINFCFWI